MWPAEHQGGARDGRGVGHQLFRHRAPSARGGANLPKWREGPWGPANRISRLRIGQMEILPTPWLVFWESVSRLDCLLVLCWFSGKLGGVRTFCGQNGFLLNVLRTDIDFLPGFGHASLLFYFSLLA